MFFASWSGLLRVLVVGVLAYATLVLLLRVSGKRTLTKMNAFDLVVTVALGSTLATVLLSKDVKLLEGILAFAVLIGMQYLVAWGSVRSRKLRRLVKSEPVLVYSRGRFLDDTLRRERLTREEVRASIREKGLPALDDVEAVVLETAGELSILPRTRPGPGSTLAGVRDGDGPGR